MTTPERLGRSLVCLLVADVLTSALFQFSGALLGGPREQFSGAAGGVLMITLYSLFVALPAWVCWLPVLWIFGPKLQGRRLVLFIVIGVLWGPLYLYAMRLPDLLPLHGWRSQRLLAHPGLWLEPQMTDFLGMIASTLTTFFYLDVVKRSERLRIQASDYDR